MGLPCPTVLFSPVGEMVDEHNMLYKSYDVKI